MWLFVFGLWSLVVESVLVDFVVVDVEGFCYCVEVFFPYVAVDVADFVVVFSCLHLLSEFSHCHVCWYVVPAWVYFCDDVSQLCVFCDSCVVCVAWLVVCHPVASSASCVVYEVCAVPSVCCPLLASWVHDVSVFVCVCVSADLSVWF